MLLNEKLAFRRCPICYGKDKAAVWGFVVKTELGNDQFNCVYHWFLRHRIGSKPLAPTSVRK